MMMMLTLMIIIIINILMPIVMTRLLPIMMVSINDEDEDIGVDCLRKPLECRQEGECRRRWL